MIHPWLVIKGSTRPTSRLRTNSFGGDSKGEVLQYIREYMTCQLKMMEHIFLTGLLQLFRIPRHMWESISINFIIGIFRVQG